VSPILLLFQRLDNHVGQKLFAREEREQILKGFGDHGAVGLLVGLEAWRAHLVGDDVDVDYDWAFDGERALDIRAQVALIGNDDAGDVIGGGYLAHIGNGKAGAAVASDAGLAEVAGLGGADGGVSIVVEDEELDGKLEAGGGLELLNIELEAAVAIDENGAPAAAGEAHGERHGRP